MALNVTALLAGAKVVAQHPLTKGGLVMSLVSGGLYAASLAGVAIPGWAVTVGPILGYVAYRLAPKAVEDDIDAVATRITDIANDIPQVYTGGPPPEDAAMKGNHLGNPPGEE